MKKNVWYNTVNGYLPPPSTDNISETVLTFYNNNLFLGRYSYLSNRWLLNGLSYLGHDGPAVERFMIPDPDKVEPEPTTEKKPFDIKDFPARCGESAERLEELSGLYSWKSFIESNPPMDYQTLWQRRIQDAVLADIVKREGHSFKPCNITIFFQPNIGDDMNTNISYTYERDKDSIDFDKEHPITERPQEGAKIVINKVVMVYRANVLFQDTGCREEYLCEWGDIGEDLIWRYAK